MSKWVFPFPKGTRYRIGQLDQGVDISAPAHTPLLAVGAGTIVRSGIGGFGPTAPVLKLDDGSGYVYYGHTGRLSAKVGQHVNAGQQIAEVGAGIVGISTGPHLEIGLATAQGAPAGRNTAHTTLALLHGATPTAGQASAALGSPGFTGQVQATNALGFDPSSLNPFDAINQALSNLFGSIHPERVALWLGLVLGGVVLAGIGVARTAGVKPSELPGKVAAAKAVIP